MTLLLSSDSNRPLRPNGLEAVQHIEPRGVLVINDIIVADQSHGNRVDDGARTPNTLGHFEVGCDHRECVLVVGEVLGGYEARCTGTASRQVDNELARTRAGQ